MYEVPTFLSSIELSIALFGQFHQDFGFPYPVTVQERIHFLDEIAQKEQLINQLKKEKLALRTWLFQQTSIYKKVMSLSDQQQVNKKIRKVMAAAELDKLKKTTFEIYADYISPLQAQYSQLTEDDLLVLCLQEAGISPLAISLCFGHTDTVALNQRKSRLKKKMSE
jgi:hypothetical protein